jgi:hypothetical protein
MQVEHRQKHGCTDQRDVKVRAHGMKVYPKEVNC